MAQFTNTNNPTSIIDIKKEITKRYGKTNNFNLKGLFENSISVKEMSEKLAKRMKTNDPTLTYLMDSCYAEALLYAKKLNHTEERYTKNRTGNTWKSNTDFNFYEIIENLDKDKIDILERKYKSKNIISVISSGINKICISLEEVFYFWELRNLEKKINKNNREKEGIKYMTERIESKSLERKKIIVMITDINQFLNYPN